VSTTTVRQAHIEQVLIEVTSLLVDRARIQLQREVEAAGGASTDPSASGDLRRLHEMDKKLRAIRREVGLAEPGTAPAPAERQVSRFYEVPGQEDA
jgi:hypothetical protein